MANTSKNLKFRTYLTEKLSNKAFRKKFIKVALEDYLAEGDYYEFLSALKALAEAAGGITKLSKDSGLSRQALYKIFSEKGNPEFLTVVNILDKIGFKISISSK